MKEKITKLYFKLKKHFQKPDFLIAVSIFIFGLLTSRFFFNISSIERLTKLDKMWFVGLFLYSIPLLSMLTRKQYVRIYSIWLGIFVVLQTLATPIISGFVSSGSDFKTLTPNLHSILDIQDGVAGIRGVQTIVTDEKGFRVTKEINYDNKTENTYRIFAIGGSTTAQDYLDKNATWTYLLQKKLDTTQNINVEVVNTGVSGLRAQHHLATLREIVKYQPDLAIFLIGINDWNYHVRMKNTEQTNFINKFPFKKTLLAQSILKIKASLTPGGKARILKQQWGASQLNSLERKRKLTFKPNEVFPEYQDYLEEISMTCKENSLKCIFLTQPNGYQENANKEYKKGFWMTPADVNYTLDFDSLIYLAKLYNDYLISFANKNGHLVCDIASQIPASYDYMYDDTHYNTAGAKKVSELVYDCLISSGKL